MMTLNSIKINTHIYTKRILADESGANTEYLDWFVSLPSEYWEFAREVFAICEAFYSGQINVDMAKAAYNDTVKQFKNENLY